MKTNTTLGNLFFALTITASITSCGSGDKKEETDVDTLATSTEIPADQPAGSTESFKDFDWSTVPQSNAEIGGISIFNRPLRLYHYR